MDRDFDAAVSLGFRLRTLIGLTLLSALLLIGAAPAAAAEDSDTVVRSPASESRSDATPLWTKERMRRAPVIDAETEDPGIDRSRARKLAREAETGDPELLAAGPTPFATVQSDRDVTDYLSYPERAHGRMFGTVPGVGDFTCSATLITSSNSNAVFTAGHCLYDKESRQFATDVIFVPAYKQGQAFYGAYSAVELVVLSGWADLDYPEAFSYDVAAMTLGESLQQLIGARGIAANVNPEGETFDIFGYPARPNPPYDGERPIHCPAADFQGYEDELYPVANPSIVAGPCYMQQGSSGGGWVLEGGYVNSVVSHGFCDTQPALCGLIHGPFFAGDAASLYTAVGGGSGEPSDSAACTIAKAEVRKQKKAKRKAAKQKRRAQKKLKQAKKNGSKAKQRKAKKQLKSKKKKQQKAKRELRKANQLQRRLLC